jgi:hypothetical protein
LKWRGSAPIACIFGGGMAWTANLSGKIHHTELASGVTAPTAVEHDD